MEIVSVVKAVLVNPSSNKLLLIRRSNTDQRRPRQWDLPGGITEPNEVLESALIRECLEETTVDITGKELKLLYSTYHLFEDQPKLVNWLIFYCETNAETATLSFEHDDYRWVSLTEAVELITYDRYHTALDFISRHQLIPGL